MNTRIIALTGLALASTAASAFAQPERPHRGERPNLDDLVVELVADYDTDADNALNAAELESAVAGIHEKRIARMKEIAEERGLDANGPRRGKGERAAPVPGEVAARLISDFDENGDAVLDTEELRGAVRAMHSRGPGKGGPRGHRRGGDSDSSSVEAQ